MICLSRASGALVERPDSIWECSGGASPQPDHFVYALVGSPGRKVFYVGVTAYPEVRLEQHLWACPSKAYRKVEMLILEVASRREAYAAERRWISALRGKHPLVNKNKINATTGERKS